ncbi:MAG: metal ABC transporter permease [Deltaproteobacteria bacterium]|nr:metal ABC transporter permease [Deltaproteobacteria bacterium]MBW2305369.1 metal ABC transporter permease [Deltaproteobacteria bacterium]
MAEMIYGFMDMILPFAWAQPDFMKRALLAVLMISPLCAAMGVLVVNFRMAFYASAISHSAFTGVALGVVLGIDARITLILFGLLMGAAVTAVRRGSELSEDTAIGVLFSTSVALGIAVISAMKGLARNLEPYLYGDILTLGDQDILLISLLFIGVMTYIAIYYNRLVFLAVHEDLAHTRGLRVKRLQYIFSLVLALVVTMSIRTIGILLITALLIIPAAAARNMSRSACGMFWTAMAIACLSSVFGLMGSYYWDTATGAAMVIGAAAAFFFSLLYRIIRA